MAERVVPGPVEGSLQHADGVWLNLRHSDYLLDWGLGSGDIKQLYLSPVEWWWHSIFNALRPEEQRKAHFIRGDAFHVAVLDGMKVYDKVYGIPPSPVSHPDHLSRLADLKAACRGLGLATNGSSLDLMMRLRGRVDLMSDAIEAFRLSGKMPISPPDDGIIRLLHRMIMRSRAELNLKRGGMTLQQALRGALTEVSVFWTDEMGVRQRCRFDFLKPSISGDLKSITDWKKGDFKAELLREIILRGYVIQWAHYDEGRRRLRQAVAEGRVYGGTAKQLERLAAVAEEEIWAWLWIFAKMDGAPQVRGILMNQMESQEVWDEKKGREVIQTVVNGQYRLASQQRDTALGNYVYRRELHGLDSLWFDSEVIWEPEEDKWPTFSVLGDPGL